MSLRTDVTKHAVIEALAREISNGAAGRSLAVRSSSHFRRMMRNRFGLAAKRFGDVVVISDRMARVEISVCSAVTA